jgi:hypothetical protein
MRKLLSMIVGVALIGIGIGTGIGAFAADDIKAQGKSTARDAEKSRRMDVDMDGMISKAEYIKYHEARYDGMKKNSRGMVDVKDMGEMVQKGYSRRTACEGLVTPSRNGVE